MSNGHAIKRGVSLYSFQEEYFLRKMSLEDCIATVASYGAQGVEVIGEQMMPGFPHQPEAFFAQWHAWMERYHTTPTAHDMFLDIQRFKGRQMNEEEMLASVIRDLQFANRLGCTVMRVIVNTPPEIMEKSVPYAEKYGVRMGIEIHAPFNFDHPWIQRHVEVVERVNSPYLGYIPDMGIFEKRYPRVRSERSIRDGGHEHIINYIREVYDRHEGTAHLEEEVKKMGGNEIDLAMADWVAHHMVFTNPRRLLDFMPHIIHIHGKFYEMLDDYTEYSIPYHEIVPVLIEGGYNGYLSSEYEGNRHIQDAFEVDSVEQVRRQQVMFRRLLGEAEA
jgi:sugar phosphate isomerase/epimerase